ncbi:DNA repair protein RecN [Paenibacillus chitinolyticus]|uniref:DNA repair protein RecN n=1 Tax=Paenibacillus chitinolyticus TaxID=79263 RepID=A0A410WV29_9BACL|nr:DNA repair protein RecN [Paenibacillus chitinolyticus]MCY9589479.1 DNA repair protein RecN [Paenibacillus chitinolyticus]MCY9599243.1 DNA repair protein RecN [Paenibacillus chitinolyticus]QAV18204.1 DNA repair protein RecN [Paenibacillus chitinolyticus]
MLTELSIRNLAVIEYVHIGFKSGFHVLTGETGAGKSIIIDALSLIVGGRGSSELVRYGSEKAEIEAVFEIGEGHPVWTTLAQLGIEAEGEEQLLIRREVTAGGKSSSRINGQLVNLTMLREVGGWLVNIHGQHEHQSLLKSDEHIHWLDAYGDKEVGPNLAAYRESYDRYTKLRKELRALQETSKQSLQMIDLYRFQVDEIAAASLKEGEDVTLAEEKSKLANAEKLYSSVAASYDTLYGASNGLEAIGKSIARIQDVAAIDSAGIAPLLEQMQSAFYQLEDAAYQLRDYRDDIEFNPERLDEIELRLDMIASLRRKYGDTIAEILAYSEKVSGELATIENKDEIIQKLQEKLDREIVQLTKAARKLSDSRKKIADRLAGEIETELRDLHMERTQFRVQVSHTPVPAGGGGLEIGDQPVKFTRDGIDLVEFLMAPNPGEPLRGLSKIASGGELSRIMLAMKSIFARLDQIPVLVFDEVDTGVSGRAAQAIAEKLSLLSRSCQVFSITHLPQVACMADVHFYIHKEVQGERTFTRVTDLDRRGRIEELARMLGGVEVTETTLHHAQEMLALADEKKSRN